MLVSHLTDDVRSRPWDQLLKVELDQTLATCVAVQENAPATPIVPAVDDYRSSVVAQLKLNVMEFAGESPVGVSPKPKSRRSSEPSKVKGARTQADVKLKPQSTETGSAGQGPTPKPVSHSS